jgi:hypothetical protein
VALSSSAAADRMRISISAAIPIGSSAAAPTQ